MSEDTPQDDYNDEIPEFTPPSEKETLQKRLDLLGIKYHHMSGVDKLKALLEESETPAEKAEKESPRVSKQQRRKEANKLVRVRISCMNPNKKEWSGEIFAAGNRHIGNIKKFVPFDVEDGWHVPEILLKVIRRKRMQQFTEKRAANGQKIKVGKLVPEYAIEVMPDLTEKELQQLAQRQAMAKSGQDD